MNKLLKRLGRNLFLIFLISFSCKKDYQKSEVIVLSTNKVTYDGTTKNGVTFSASIMLDSEYNILEQGFVVDLKSDPTLDDEVVRVNEVSNKSFSILFEDILVPDTAYYVRGYVKTEKYLVYGNEVEFYSNGSQPPLISKIEPSVAFWGDTILITGENFDKSGKNNKVYFNDLNSKKVWGSKDTIYVIVPDELNEKKSELKVSLYGQDSENTKSFEIYSPIIENVNKTQGQFPDTIVINGDRFNPEYIDISLDGYECKIIAAGREEISFIVPFIGKGGEYLLRLNQVNENQTVADKFQYNEQEIYGLPDEGVFYGDDMVIKGNNIDFRMFPLTVYVDNYYMNDAYYKKYQDSISFRLKNSWYDLKKDNIYFLKEGISGTKIFESIFSFRNPQIEMIDKETVVNGTLIINAKGCSFGMVYLQGPVTESHYLTMTRNEGEWSLRYDLLPGTYHFYYESEILGRSETNDFTILQPVLNSLEKNSYSRKDELIVINGDNLPINMWSGNTNFKIKHLDSDRIFHFNSRVENLSNNQINPLWLVGKGEYEIYLQLRGEKISNSLPFFFEDDFEYVDSIAGFVKPPNWNAKGLKWGNNLFIGDGWHSYLVDLDSKAIKGVEGIESALRDLVRVGDNVFFLDEFGMIYTIKDVVDQWQATVIELPELVDAIFLHEDDLWYITRNGEVYEYNGGDIQFFGSIPNYERCLYAYANNSELFLFKQTNVVIRDMNSLIINEMIEYDIDDFMWTEKNFVPSKNGIGVYHNRTFSFFDLDNHTFSSPNEYGLPGYYDSVLFNDDNDDLFLLNENHIYKY